MDDQEQEPAPPSDDSGHGAETIAPPDRRDDAPALAGADDSVADRDTREDDVAGSGPSGDASHLATRDEGPAEPVDAGAEPKPSAAPGPDPDDGLDAEMADDLEPDEGVGQGSAIAPVPEDEPGPEPSRKAVGRRRRRSLWREIPALAVIALLVALVVKVFFVQAFYIPSGSMESTLQVGDRVLVNKAVYRFRDVRRGEVVVFDGTGSWEPEAEPDEPDSTLGRLADGAASAFGVTSSDERDFVKRVIGVPGDHVVCCDDEGRITVNGVPLDETYLYPGDKPSEVEFDVEVPEGRLWVMGDHRSDSRDSREFMGAPGGGTIPVDDVVGRATVVVWPLDRVANLDVPSTFDRPTLASLVLRTPVLVGVVALGPVSMVRRRRRSPSESPDAWVG